MQYHRLLAGTRADDGRQTWCASSVWCNHTDFRLVVCMGEVEVSIHVCAAHKTPSTFKRRVCDMCAFSILVLNILYDDAPDFLYMCV